MWPSRSATFQWTGSPGVRRVQPIVEGALGRGPTVSREVAWRRTILKRPDISSNPEDRRLVRLVLGEWMPRWAAPGSATTLAIVGMATTWDRVQRSIVRVADPRGRSGSPHGKAPSKAMKGAESLLANAIAHPRCPLTSKIVSQRSTDSPLESAASRRARCDARAGYRRRAGNARTEPGTSIPAARRGSGTGSCGASVNGSTPAQQPSP